MNRWRCTARIATIVATMLVVSACGGGVADVPGFEDRWVGTSESGGVESALTLETTRDGVDLEGVYRVDAVRGAFLGSVSDGVVEAVLTPTATCTYDLRGAMTTTEITAEFSPRECPGGSEGTWNLERE